MHSSEFQYLLGPQEIQMVPSSLIQPFRAMSEPIITVVNKNIFVHAGLSLEWTTTPAKYLQHHNPSGNIEVNSVSFLNNMASSILRATAWSRHMFENEQHPSPLYYTGFADSHNIHICEKLYEVLDIVGVSCNKKSSVS